MVRRTTLHALHWLALLCIGLFATPATAQGPWAPRTLRLELRGELAWPTGELAQVVGGEHGFGFGLAARYVPVRPLALYAGWERFAFNEKDHGVETHVRDMGVRAGVQLSTLLGEHVPVRPFVLGGALYNWTRLKRATEDFERTVHADPALGFEVGAGAAVHTFRGVWLVPEGRYRRHSAGVSRFPDTDGDLGVAYFALNLGLLFGH